MAIDLTEQELAYLASMFDAAREGRTRDVLIEVEAGLPVNLTNTTGDTLLILAAYHDHPATVRGLLDAGADPERVNDRGQTALGAAVFRRSVDSVRALLAAGARPGTGQRSALDVADFFDLTQMRALLTETIA